MKDKPTGRRPESSIDPATEARVVALILGEASDFEEDELNRLVAKWPEMRLLKSRLEVVNELLEEVARPRLGSSWRLSENLRKKMLAAMDFFSVIGDDDQEDEEGAQGEPPEHELRASRVPESGSVVQVEGRLSQSMRRKRVLSPWRTPAVACLSIGLIGVVVYSPTIFEDRSYLAAEYEIPEGKSPDFGSYLQPEFEELSEGSSTTGEKLAALAANFRGWNKHSLEISSGSQELAGLAGEEERGNDIRDALQTKLELVDSQLEKLSGVVEEHRFDSVDKMLQTQDYVEAKEDYEAAKSMLQTMKVTSSSKRIALKIPKRPITIHQTGTKAEKKGGTIFGGGVYESQAVVQVTPSVLDLDRLVGRNGSSAMSVLATRSDMANEIAAVKSEKTLREVVERLKLVDRWGTTREGALEELKKSVSAGQVRGTDLVGVKVRVKEKDDAAAIATEVAKVYQERRRIEERVRAGRALEALESEVRAQEDQVEEKRMLFHTIVKAVGIPFVDGLRGSGQMGRSEEEILSVAQREIFAREKEKRELEIQLKTLMEIEGGELMRYTAGLNLPGVSSVKHGVAPLSDKALDSYSTFSLHVSDVSFKLARAALGRGEWPKPETIRVEEFGNAFDYGGLPPSMDERIGASIEQAAHPFLQQRNLLRISVRTAARGRAVGTPLRLTVLLDNSGSMVRRDRVESVQRAFALLAAQMKAEDRVTLICFARRPRLLADRVPGNEVGELAELIAMTQPEGGTNLEEALLLGLSKAQEQWSGDAQNRVVLMTDGAANLGNAKPEDLRQLVLAMRGRGIAFDACGVGADGYNDTILESLTREGNGRYYFLDQPEDADEGFARQIAGALRPAAEDVKVQVQFNPRRVARFQLFGFDNHRLATEDFRDDAVDAAELGAEEEGNALYQYELLPEGMGPVGTVSVRFLDRESGQRVERQWLIPYRASMPRLEEAGKGIRLAACATFLGEKLKGTAMGDGVKMKDLWQLANGLADHYPMNPRVWALREMVGQVREMESGILE